MADLLLKFTKCCYYGNMGESSKNLNDFVWLADPQNTQFGAKFSDIC